MKDWKPFYDECSHCGGSDVHVLTDANKDGFAYDGDDAECQECGTKGSVCINGDEDSDGECTAYVSWNEEED